MTLSLGSTNLQQQLAELGGPVYLLIISLLQKKLKNTKELPSEEKHRARSRGGPNTGASVPVGFGVHQPRSSLNLIVQEFLWRLYYIALID